MNVKSRQQEKCRGDPRGAAGKRPLRLHRTWLWRRSIDAISSEARVTKGAFYHHFAGGTAGRMLQRQVLVDRRGPGQGRRRSTSGRRSPRCRGRIDSGWRGKRQPAAAR